MASRIGKNCIAPTRNPSVFSGALAADDVQLTPSCCC
jgi:hypothetical protein